ncbi:MAG: helix-turn-helix domain-containing protein [Atribacterota bacterium]|nr:helix-turn-helix domain-containing protein [Atribacterota bacterium]
MDKEKPNRQTKSSKYSFTTISDYFLDEWSGVVGVGPTSLYIHLLKYCYKEKNLAWPTLKTLSKKMGVSERSLIRYQKTLVKYGFIRNIFKRNSTSRNNIYQMALGRDLIDLAPLPSMMTNCQVDSDNMSACKVTIRQPNNNNLKYNNIITTTKREKAAVAGVDFKKIKEKGDLSACGHAQAEEKMQETKKRMMELDFKEELIEKILKDFSTKKIEEKLDLLMERRNIQNPAGWLIAALKHNYQDVKREEDDEEPVAQVSHLSQENKKILSHEEAIRRFRLLRQKLATNDYFRKGEI